jgi:hypothetical protein
LRHHHHRPPRRRRHQPQQIDLKWIENLTDLSDSDQTDSDQSLINLFICVDFAFIVGSHPASSVRHFIAGLARPYCPVLVSAQTRVPRRSVYLSQPITARSPSRSARSAPLSFSRATLIRFALSFESEQGMFCFVVLFCFVCLLLLLFFKESELISLISTVSKRKTAQRKGMSRRWWEEGKSESESK